ncbi:pyridoxal phosphate-dependent decarboxylase family protein, partial [Enterobacter roggenkampii]
MSELQFIEQSPTSSESEHLQTLIDYVQALNRHIQLNARSNQSMLPELTFAPDALETFGPKYPIQPFSYLDELEQAQDETPASEAELYNEVARYFRGAIRPQSRNSLFNMVPEPSIAATAGAWLATAY